MTPPLSLLVPSIEDASALAYNDTSAFWHEPMWRKMWPKDKTLPFLIEASSKRFPLQLTCDRPINRYLKAVNPETGAILGFARWELPHDKSEEWKEAQVLEASPEEVERFKKLRDERWWEPSCDYGEIDTNNDAIEERIWAEKPYIRFSYLAVHPDHQGQGIASALVHAAIKTAEEISVSIFVTAWKSSRGLFKRAGFREVEYLVQDDSKYGGNGEHGVYFLVYDVGHTKT